MTRDRTDTTVGTLTTDAQGKAAVDNLLADDYTITETKGAGRLRPEHRADYGDKGAAA